MRKYSEKTRQILQAIAIGPLAIIPAMLLAISFAFLLALWRTHEIPTNILSEFTAALMMALVGLIYGYAFTVLYGFPVYLALKKIKMANITSFSLLSLLPAFIAGVRQSSLMSFLFIGYFSLSVAVAFWWLAPKQKKALTIRPT